MSCALVLLQGATRTLEYTFGDGITGDLTGQTITISLNKRNRDGSVGAEVWRSEIAGGAVTDGVFASDTVEASETAALPAGSYWHCLAIAAPTDGEDLVTKFDDYPVIVASSGPLTVAASGVGAAPISGGNVSRITVQSPQGGKIKVGGPVLGIATYTLANGDPIPIGAVTGLQTALDAKLPTTDPRLTDARTPTAHKASHATGGSDALTPADIGAATSVHTHAELHTHTNYATLAKITESAGLPLWDGGAWPGGTGSAAPSEVEALGTASAAEAIILHAATHGGGTLTLAAGAYPTVTLSGAVAGALYQYVLTIANQGVSYPVFPGVHWAVGHAPDWSVAGTWEIVLRTTDGGTVISGAAYYLAIVGTRRIWYSDWSATDTTDLASVVPTPGAALVKVASGGKITASATLRTRGGHVEAVVSASTASTYAAYTADLGTSDYTLRVNSSRPSEGQSHRPVLFVCYIDSSNFVAVTRISNAVDMYAVVAGVESTLGTISLANHTRATLVDLIVTKVGASLSVTAVGVQPFGAVTINSLPNPSSTLFGIGVRTANTSADTSMILGDVEVIGS